MIHNNPTSEKSIGFIAQDVKEVFPELVKTSTTAETGYKGVTDINMINYSGFGPLAIKAIQEQQLMIQALQAELDQLRKMISDKEKPNYLTINQ
jgi:trimeric autotransporter adhesin